MAVSLNTIHLLLVHYTLVTSTFPNSLGIKWKERHLDNYMCMIGTGSHGVIKKKRFLGGRFMDMQKIPSTISVAVDYLHNY